ncbi:lipid-A-disaccharide synthase N-terminal domain-containing protein [Hymenobacter translucens]|uniref:lipid-A-disaccharide synthase N-terminal domain-containing protein n=1 Tax=Hymenobacter translucens TaxID=2886507 RepID=UPI00374CC870
MALQWVQSEREGRVLVSRAFWLISLVSAFLMLVYGLLRQDPLILGAQLVSYGIYIRNLQLLGQWHSLTRWLRIGICLVPLVTIGWLLATPDSILARAIREHGIPAGWLLVGGAGQALSLLRFVYQWLYSERRGASVLPLGFWVVSLLGSVLTIVYAIFRVDLVLILGNAVGLVIYTRNLLLLGRTRRQGGSI